MLARMANAWAPLAQLHEDVNRMFEEMFQDLPASGRSYGAAYPPLNAWADDEAAHVEAELPGLSMNDVELLVEGDRLTINGKRKLAAPENAACYRNERAQGEFSRTLTLPWAIDADKVEAKLVDGVLWVRMPRTAAARAKKIAVNAA